MISDIKTESKQMQVILLSVRYENLRLLKDVELLTKKANNKKRKRKTCTDIHNLSKGGYRNKRICAFK